MHRPISGVLDRQALELARWPGPGVTPSTWLPTGENFRSHQRISWEGGQCRVLMAPIHHALSRREGRREEGTSAYYVPNIQQDNPSSPLDRCVLAQCRRCDRQSGSRLSILQPTHQSISASGLLIVTMPGQCRRGTSVLLGYLDRHLPCLGTLIDIYMRHPTCKVGHQKAQQ